MTYGETCRLAKVVEQGQTLTSGGEVAQIHTELGQEIEQLKKKENDHRAELDRVQAELAAKEHKSADPN
ncbi:hypothetical protein R1flu_016283 [Riccia fluitans]|uniref:Uncharacterized protein n=1 Tax=Riccia fluitans TaxID=41844 RepID=A0ABD1YQ99_9MARC